MACFRKPAVPARLLRVAAAAVLILLPGVPGAHGGDAPSGGNDGISYDEYIRNIAPAPVSVRAGLDGGKPLIVWAAPTHPAGKLFYDPVIVGYRVYVVDRKLRRTLIGETTATRFRDATAPSGSLRRYAVTAVQRSGQESSLSKDVQVRVP